MKRIYVAGKTHDYQRVRKVQQVCRSYGHMITYDWTACVEHHGPEHEIVMPTLTQELEYATNDAKGVALANLVIALGHAKLCGTLVEIGMALAAPLNYGDLRRDVWLVGVEQPSVFWALPQITILARDEDIAHELELL